MEVKETTVPRIMFFIVGVVLILTGIYIGFNTWGYPHWLYCPGLIGMGSPLLICSFIEDWF